MRPFVDGPGKAMIVCATGEICANIYSAIVALRPEWHSDEIDKALLKVVYSGAPSDKPPVVDHVRRDSQNAVIKERLRNVDDELEIIIVKDMMLTGTARSRYTRSTLTGRLRAPCSCRPSPGSTAPSAARKTDSSSPT